MKQVSIPDFTNPLAQPFLKEGGEHAVLLIHGFTGSIAHMRMLADGLYEKGFTVKGINLPGHAANLEAMKKTGWEDWLGAARSALTGLKEKYRHVSVMGLSMGGVISLILSSRFNLRTHGGTEQADAVRADPCSSEPCDSLGRAGSGGGPEGSVL